MQLVTHINISQRDGAIENTSTSSESHCDSLDTLGVEEGWSTLCPSPFLPAVRLGQ